MAFIYLSNTTKAPKTGADAYFTMRSFMAECKTDGIGAQKLAKYRCSAPLALTGNAAKGAFAQTAIAPSWQ